jgi:hypothetical protein
LPWRSLDVSYFAHQSEQVRYGFSRIVTVN